MKCYELVPIWRPAAECYEVSAEGIIPGLPIRVEKPKSCSVLVGGPGYGASARVKRALFSEPLADELEAARGKGSFSHTASRLQQCEVDVRNDVWLLPSSGETSNDVLLLVSYVGSPIAKKVPFVTYEVHGKHSRILLATAMTLYKPATIPMPRATDRSDGKAVLAHLKPGDCLEVKVDAWAYRPFGERSFLKRALDDFRHHRLIASYRITATGAGQISLTS